MEPAPAQSLDVGDLLITAELEKRPTRIHRYGTTGLALRELSRQIGEEPADTLPRFVELARQLCGGGSAGISVYEPQPEGAGIFRWAGLVGRAAPFNGQTTPRDFSPCGICLDRGEVILMDRPGRYYGWLNLPGVPLTEALLVPLFIRGKAPFGTLWIMSHDDHRFDREDEQALSELASVACLAIGLLADVADQKALLAQVKRQASKMETLGQLTSGIAHDFNNLLTVLTGELEIIKRSVQDDKIRTRVDYGLKSALRGEKLVQRLMAFARRKPSQPEIIEPRAILVDIVDLLARSLPTLTLDAQIADDLWPILADQSQLESAILNLAINARDAMPNGGRLLIVARNARLPEEPDALGPAGEFVAITVSDDGLGMSPATLARAVEPFFTTKGVGVGTGLGLSMVHDFATQASGTVRIASELGKGTAVTIHLPRAQASG